MSQRACEPASADRESEWEYGFRQWVQRQIVMGNLPSQGVAERDWDESKESLFLLD